MTCELSEKSKKKVAHVITMLELGGAQQNTLYTVSHLNKEHYEVYLVAHDKGFLVKEAKKLTGFHTLFLPALRRKIRPWSDVVALYQLYRFFRREKIDIVHTHSSKAGVLGRVAAWLARVPVIIHTIHGFGFHDSQSRIVKKIYVILERVCARISDQLVAVAYDNIRKGLQEGIGKRDLYRVIRSGIDIKRFSRVSGMINQELGIPINAKLIGQIGNFKPQKNPLDFVRVAALVAKQVPDSYFLMVGDGILRPDIERLIRELGLDDQVKLTGWRQDVEVLIQHLDVLALTSRWEGLPRVYLQAMAGGKPVVGTAVDGGPEAIRHGENGYMLPVGDTQGMADKISYLLTHDAVRRKMGERGRELVREFDIDLMVRQQEDMYKELSEMTKK
ncbi:MAG: hypothetical protein B6244_02065 [Candidatus Cloacimonetes bacterium 4572_55]|nr:MAG: hypothetical protein B6244_02065 [Candidatus Cloacimonetes bacterium 4572_55]